MSRARRITIAWVVACLLLMGGRTVSFAQADDELWSPPVNLSRSGAAESPVLVVGPDGQIQVFWWDRFDGLTTAYALAGSWSDPVQAPIRLDEEEGVSLTPSTVAVMPQIVGVGETAFALWLGEPDQGTNVRALLYSRLRLDTAVWTTPETLVESAIAWELTSDAQGVLHLVYCQAQQLAELPAGIYYKRSTDGGVTWSAPVALYTSLYTRLWAAETVHLSIAVDVSGSVVAGWDDTRQELAFYVLSTNGGLSWTEPAVIGDGEIVGLRPRLIPLPARLSRAGRPGLLMLWQQKGVASTCVLWQQHSADGGRTWSTASRVFEDLTTCPVQMVTAQTAMEPLLLMRGEETGYLLLSVWDGEQWSEIRRLSFSFENLQTGAMAYLEALRANVMSNNALVVVGQERNGDIWALWGQVDALEWVFTPPSPWSDPTTIFRDESISGFPAVATDAKGAVHVLWSTTTTPGQSSLYYSRRDATAWSRPAVVLDADEGVAQMPVLVFVEPYLHVVWSSGSMGTVFYSRSYPDDAFAASSWSAPLTPGGSVMGSAPALTVDLLGQLHLVYAVPFNEGRGIYYTRTDNGGESWQEAVQLFDAVAEGWPSLDRPNVTVDERGGIHVVWSRMPLPGYGLPQGVYYAQSTDHGETWSNAMLLADGPYDWPQVAATLTGQVVVTWQDLTRNVVEYRDSSDYGLNWGYVSQVPGLQTIDGRAVLVQDGTGRLHITALDTRTGSYITLRHLIYAGAQWSALDSVVLQDMYAPVVGAAPAVRGTSGLIDVVGLASQRVDDELLPVIWQTRRTIEIQAALQPDFAPLPTPTPTPGPTPAPTPTPRPEVNPYPPQPSAPVLALGPISLPLLAFAGIGGALLLVGGVVVIKIVKRQV